MTSILGIFLIVGIVAAAPKDDIERVHYLRLTPNRPVAECHFTVRNSDQGWNITSVTGSGASTMTVTARYDMRHTLIFADCTRTEGGRMKTARVEVKSGKASVKRDAKEAQEFDVPNGVIVTSAPDWSDTFLLCRVYDRKKGGKQEFAGLWIHPEQPAQRLAFSIERTGTDTVEHDDKKLELDRCEIRLRNGSPYVAWIDNAGQMIKLMSLQSKGNDATTLVREGFERATAKLQQPR